MNAGRSPAAALQVYYGGTFDPFHNAHLAIARGVRDALHAQVHLVPAADPPHRARPGASADDRAAMVAAGIAGEPGLLLERIEIERDARNPQRPSYTVDTLAQLRVHFGPRQPLAWLIGGDSLASLQQWHQWQRLFALAHIVVVARPGSPLPEQLPPALAAQVAGGTWAASARRLQARPGGCLLAVRLPLRDESSTQVRAALAAGGSIAAMVPAGVARLVAERRLYGVHCA